MLPSPLAHRFGIVFASFSFYQHTRLPQTQPNSKSNFLSGAFLFFTLLPHSGDRNWFLNGREELSDQSFYSIFFTPPRWADAAFMWHRPARICAGSLQNRTHRHDAPHTAEQARFNQRSISQPHSFALSLLRSFSKEKSRIRSLRSFNIVL